MTHICVGNLTIIGPDNGLSPGRRQAIIWTNAGILLIGPWGTNFSEILIGIDKFSFKKIHFKMSSGKWRPFCLGLNVLSFAVPLFQPPAAMARSDQEMIEKLLSGSCCYRFSILTVTNLLRARLWSNYHFNKTWAIGNWVGNHISCNPFPNIFI